MLILYFSSNLKLVNIEYFLQNFSAGIASKNTVELVYSDTGFNEQSSTMAALIKVAVMHWARFFASPYEWYLLHKLLNLTSVVQKRTQWAEICNFDSHSIWVLCCNLHFEKRAGVELDYKNPWVWVKITTHTIFFHNVLKIYLAVKKYVLFSFKFQIPQTIVTLV